jgi:hypothetical protein
MSGAEGKAVKGVDGMSVREESVGCMVELGVVVLSSRLSSQRRRAFSEHC